MSFFSIHKDRKQLLSSNRDVDHVVLVGEGNVLLSAPHGVNQVRLGREKFKEIGSLATALYLHKKTKAHLIAKTKNNSDDANFDNDCKYRKTLSKLIEKKEIKYLIDIHGLAKRRECDVNLGIHLGKNIQTKTSAFEKLKEMLTTDGFSVSIDQPFMAGSQTIAGGMKDKFSYLWTIQIEINIAITNEKENFEKYSRILCLLLNWIEGLN